VGLIQVIAELGAILIIAAALSGNYQRVLSGRTRAEATSGALTGPTSAARIEQVARDGLRYDRLCLTATRNIEAASALTAAIAALSIQLLHRDAPTLTRVGFFLAVGAFIVSLVASLLVLSSPIRIEERGQVREAAAQIRTGEAFTLVISARRDAWIGLVLRMVAVGTIAVLVVAAIGCMGIGQFSVPGRP
jgi:hypothetical protein